MMHFRAETTLLLVETLLKCPYVYRIDHAWTSWNQKNLLCGINHITVQSTRQLLHSDVTNVKFKKRQMGSHLTFIKKQWLELSQNSW